MSVATTRRSAIANFGLGPVSLRSVVAETHQKESRHYAA